MILIEKEPALSDVLFPEELKNAKRLVFYDIETTGLSAYASSLYLIGALVFEDGCAKLYQWFAPSLFSELEILRAFFSFLRPDDLLVSFNGDTFDRNYLEACASQYTLPCPLKDLEGTDLLKKIRKHRTVLGLPDLKQKSVERFLGIPREDRYTGGELIHVYEEYTKQPDDRRLKLLLLHNEEDLLGMPALLPVLLYTEALETPGTPEEIWQNKSGSALYISYSYPYRFPVPLSYTDPGGISCDFSEDRLTLTVPVLQDELKYFFPNYRDYYYLPVEDRAIHKKLGRFVDKNCRVQATAQTCFQKRAGSFLPALKNSGFPCFRSDYDSVTSYHYLEDNSRFPDLYARAFLGTL